MQDICHVKEVRTSDLAKCEMAERTRTTRVIRRVLAIVSENINTFKMCNRYKIQLSI